MDILVGSPNAEPRPGRDAEIPIWLAILPRLGGNCPHNIEEMFIGGILALGNVDGKFTLTCGRRFPRGIFPCWFLSKLTESRKLLPAVAIPPPKPETVLDIDDPTSETVEASVGGGVDGALVIGILGIY